MCVFPYFWKVLFVLILLAPLYFKAAPASHVVAALIASSGSPQASKKPNVGNICRLLGPHVGTVCILGLLLLFTIAVTVTIPLTSTNTLPHKP